MQKLASKLLETHSQRCRFCLKIPGSTKRTPRKCKIIVRNRVFECLTLLKIEIIVYGNMGFIMA